MERKTPDKSIPSPISRYHSRVIRQTELATGLYELELDRKEMAFTAGAEIILHGSEPTLDRTYSIASGEKASTLRILYRLIPDGARTPQLAKLRSGMEIDFTGPTGNFHLKNPDSPCIFIATGTGIAPAISFLETYPQMDMTLIHGVREIQDLAYSKWLQEAAYTPCVSGQVSGDYFSGRVSQYAVQHPVPPGKDIYLCGSNPMIEEVRALLLAQGHDSRRMFSEPYYFW